MKIGQKNEILCKKDEFLHFWSVILEFFEILLWMFFFFWIVEFIHLSKITNIGEVIPEYLFYIETKKKEAMPNKKWIWVQKSLHSIVTRLFINLVAQFVVNSMKL